MRLTITEHMTHCYCTCSPVLNMRLTVTGDLPHRYCTWLLLLKMCLIFLHIVMVTEDVPHPYCTSSLLLIMCLTITAHIHHCLRCYSLLLHVLTITEDVPYHYWWYAPTLLHVLTYWRCDSPLLHTLTITYNVAYHNWSCASPLLMVCLTSKPCKMDSFSESVEFVNSKLQANVKLNDYVQRFTTIRCCKVNESDVPPINLLLKACSFPQKSFCGRSGTSQICGCDAKR